MLMVGATNQKPKDDVLDLCNKLDDVSLSLDNQRDTDVFEFCANVLHDESSVLHSIVDMYARTRFNVSLSQEF